MSKLNLIVLFCLFSLPVFSQNSAEVINQKLGRGVNFGNMFESERNGNSLGPEVPEFFFEEIADKGFNSIRVPIKWSDYALEDAPFTIEAEFIDTIKTIVDLALEYQLMVVINMHHYDEIFQDPEGHQDRFLAIWDQISFEFKDYSDSLLFELLNEPHANLDQAKWNALFPIALDTVRKENPTRKVIIGPPDWNGIGSTGKLEWPDSDTNLIMTVHYYNPFEFTHQNAGWVGGSSAWLGTTWDSTDAQLQAVINDFAEARAFSDTKNVPVYVGEFGAYSAADMNSRKQWTAYIARKIEEFGFSWAYWEFSSGFGVYDAGSGIWRNELLNALTEQTDPNSIPGEPWEVRNSDFSRGFLGWYLWFQGGAEASAKVINEEVFIDIPLAGSETWHVQLAQTEIYIMKGAEYEFSFDARSDLPLGSINASIGKNSDPFNSYSGSHNYTLTETMQNYSFEFIMNETSDPKARVVFNLSDLATKLYFDNIELELLSLPIFVQSIALGPNPAIIDSDSGSLQLTYEVFPEDAFSQDVSWEIISGKTLASISEAGIITANGSNDGIVVVRANATDDSEVYEDIDVELRNQTVGLNNSDLNPYKVWVSGNKIELRIPESDKQNTVNLYSIDGRKLFSNILPPKSRNASIIMDRYESNIYIVEIRNEESSSIQKVFYQR